jgi:archaemetzincin
MKNIYILSLGIDIKELCSPLIEKLKKPLNPSNPPFKLLSETDLPEYAYNTFRGQYNSSKILSRLVEKHPPDAAKILAITNIDLCTPILDYVFGAAQLNGKTAIVSTHRLRPEFYNKPANEKLLLERTLKEALHELGHTFGLVHCLHYECAMHFSPNVKDIDNKKSSYCPSCKKFIEGRIASENN